MPNIYEQTVRYSFEETRTVTAHSKREAEAKFSALRRVQRISVVMPYGDMDKKVLSTRCIYKEGK